MADEAGGEQAPETALESIQQIRADRPEPSIEELTDGQPEQEDPQEDGEGSDSSDGTPEEAGEGDGEDELEEATEGDSEARLEELKQRFAEDPEAALREAFGEDALDKLKVEPKQFAALRRERKRLERERTDSERELQERGAKQEADFKEKAERAIRQLQPANEWHNAIQGYIQSGDPDALVDQFEKAVGENFPAFLKKYTEGRKGRPPGARQPRVEDPQVAALKQKLEALEQRLQEPQEDPEQRRQQELQRFYSQLDEELSGDPVTQLSGWQQKVYQEMRREYDPKLGGSRISPAKAAKRVVRRIEKAAEGLGLTKAQRNQVSAKRKPPKNLDRTRRETETRPEPYSEESAMREVLQMRRQRRKGDQ